MRKWILPVFNYDEIVQSIKYDKLITIMGHYFCNKYVEDWQQALIRDNLSYLGQFKLSLIKTYSEFTIFQNYFIQKIKI